jgi:hypothetical protein
MGREGIQSMATNKMKRYILGIDPGTVESAWVLYDTVDRLPLKMGLESNDQVLFRVAEYAEDKDTSLLAIEMIASYGMPVGQTTFETVLWLGRFIQLWVQPGGRKNRRGNLARKIFRKADTCMHLCHSPRAKDANITAAICDRYGGDQKAAKGTKKEPGPLFGIKKDIWQALGVAITAAETKPNEDNLIR